MSITSNCPHCQAPFQAPNGVSELTCPHCQKQVKLEAEGQPANAVGAEKGQKDKSSLDARFLDPEELKGVPFPLDQLVRDKRYQDTAFPTESLMDEESYDFLEGDFLPTVADAPQGSVPDYPFLPGEDQSLEPASAPAGEGASPEAYPQREEEPSNAPAQAEAPSIRPPAPQPAPQPARRAQKASGPLTFDPTRPAEYLQSLTRVTHLDGSSRSCIAEALHTYRAGCYKASAVLLSVATERIYLDFRQTFVACFRNVRKDASWDQTSKARVHWRQMAQTLYTQLLAGARKYPERGKEWQRLARALDARVDAFSYLLRLGRDEAYRPANFEFVTAGEVHAALAMLPCVAELVNHLRQWMERHLSPVVAANQAAASQAAVKK
jgi:hypothetical protein